MKVTQPSTPGKVINLFSLKQPAIIVKAETGLIYSNQTSGVACNHPRQEGFLVLLDPPREGVTVFDPQRWYDEMPALDDALYDELERVLNDKHNFMWHVHGIRVDRNNPENQEAWIHITFRGDFSTGGWFTRDPNIDPQYDDYPEYEGIISWENCD